MEQYLDCRGLACPGPVLKTKEMVERQGVSALVVFVDNPAARENVSRFLERVGYRVSWTEEQGGFSVRGVRECEKDVAMEPLPSEVVCAVQSSSPSDKVLIVVATDRIGREIEEGIPRDSSQHQSVLGEALMRNFIATLKEMCPRLWRIVFLNAGVRLATTGSPVLETLRELQREGVSILVCGTCLNFYGLMGEKQVGETTNMLDIVTSMDVAHKVITIT